jgi:hypothetical protein
MLDSAGERITSHDGVPRDRTAPTNTWLPGDIVPDTHRFPVHAGTPPGIYQLWVGMYTWPDLQRLPVRDRTGTEQPNQTLLLGTVAVEPVSP